MGKRSLMIGLYLIVISIALLAQAQGDQPLSPPTVNAVVQTLLAQTAIAPVQQATQHAATQTIQVALRQALTATAQELTTTAQAQITPTPTLETFDTSHLNVGTSDEIDLIAGPTGAAAYLAPDGQKFAYLSGADKTLCIYHGGTKGSCVATTPIGGVETESVRWSPDSRYFVFTQDFFRYFRDPDIWVWDTITNALRDLTPGPGPRINLLTSDWTGVDLMPAWLPDGRILFLRYSRHNGIILPPDIYTIAVDGSGLDKLGTLDVSDQFSVTALDVTATQLVYNYASQQGSNLDGVWLSNLDGTSPRLLIHVSHDEAIVSGVQMSPDRRFVLYNTVPLSNPTILTAATSRMRLVEVRLSEPLLIDPDHFVSAAGWSPQGSALLYVTHDSLQPENDAVYLTNAPGTAGQQLTTLQGRFNLPTPRLQGTLGWGANNTVLLSRSPATGIVLVHLE